MISQENIRKNIKPIFVGASALILIAVLVPTLTMEKSPTATDVNTTETSNTTQAPTTTETLRETSPRFESQRKLNTPDETNKTSTTTTTLPDTSPNTSTTKSSVESTSVIANSNANDQQLSDDEK